jgi:hypothetical protein
MKPNINIKSIMEVSAIRSIDADDELQVKGRYL